MRILQMLPRLQSGGVETGTVDVAKALKKMGHEVFVMSAGGELVRELVKAGIQHVTLPVHAKSVTALFLIKPVMEFIRKERIDIVHARSRVPAWIGYWAARKTGSVFVTTCHGYYSEHALSKVMGWGKEVIVISRIIGRHMIDDFGVSPARIHLIYRGVDLTQYPFHPAKYSATERRKAKFVIANVGRLTPIKGQAHFIKAFLFARQRIPNLEGWIVGGPDKGKEKYADELKGLVKKLGLEKEILFLGRRDDIPAILEQTDVLTLTTHVPEAFGRVLIEAGASGTAVVSTQVGGVVEVVEHGKTGLLVPVNDEQELARSWIDLYEHPEKMREYAQNLRKKVESEFSLQNMVEKTVRVYEHGLAHKRILVTKLGSLGDLILAVPSLRMIRKKFPKAFIALLVDPRWYGIMKLCPYLDEVWTFDRQRKQGRWGRLLKLAKRFQAERFDLSVDLQNNFKTHLLAYRAGIPLRYGHERGLSSRLLTHRAEPVPMPVPPVEHQFKLLNLLGISELDDKLELWVKEEDKKRIHSLLEDAWVNDTQRLIAFSLAASPGWPTKNWPVEHYMNLAVKLGTQMNARIFLLGDEKAKPLADRFNQEDFPFVTNLVGKTSLQELIALIARMDLVVTGDSAPMHIAAALRTRFVALFGPTDSNRHLPPAKHYKVFQKDIPCAPCYSGRCKAKEFSCLPAITVEEVFQAVKELVPAEKRAVPVP